MNKINLKMINKYIMLLLVVMVFNLYPNPVQSAVKLNVSTKGLASNDGLVGWWTFDGKNISNGVIRDTSGNGNNANAINISSSTFYSIGKLGQAVNFDGSDDSLVITDPGSGVLDFGTAQNFTITGWFKASKSLSSTDQAIIGKGFSGSGPGYGIRVTSDASCWVGNGSTTAEPTYTNITPNTWYHIACVRSGTTLSIYINGQLANSSTNGIIDDDLSNANSLCIGMRSAGCTTNEFGGLIDDLKIYSKALGAQDIAKLYSLGGGNGANRIGVGNSNNINSGLVAWWTFDGKDMVQNVLDRSGRGNTGYLSLGAAGNVSTTSALLSGRLGQGISFDGKDDEIIFPDSTDFDAGNAFTSCGWMYVDGAAQSLALISQWDSSNPSATGWVSGRTISSLGNMTVRSDIRVGGVQYITTGSTMAANEWHHVCTVFDLSNSVSANRLRTIVDGGKQSTTVVGTVSAGVDAGDTLSMGKLSSGSYSKYRADDVRLYNRALTNTEIAQLYNQGASKLNTSHLGITSSGQNSSDAGVNNGLTVHWTFDNKYVGILSTVSLTFRSVGTTSALTATSIETPKFLVPGKVGQAFNLDGVNDNLGNNTSPLYDAPYASSSWCVWVKPLRVPSSSAPSYIISKNNTTVNGYQLSQESVASVSGRQNVFTILVMDSVDADEARIESASNAWSINQWTYVCFTVVTGSSTGLRLYINGVEDPNSPVSLANIDSISNITGNQLKLGSNSASSANSYFKGVLDELRFYRARALSASEIKTLYTTDGI